MSWNDIIGHGRVVERFKTSFNNNRLANTYLFVGREGVGKRMFAMELAQTLFCKNRSAEFHSCGTCPNCIQISSGNHPDLILISKPSDKSFLPVELFIGDREHRRQRGLCHDINLTPFGGDRKFAIIDDADFFNAESANSLLKILEEPPNNSILILIGTSEHRQLPTILSRSQVVRFAPLQTEQVLSVLTRLAIQSHVSLDNLAAASDGSISRAIALNDEDLFDFRTDMVSRVASLDPADGGFAKIVCDYVDAVSKESAVRRKRLVLLGDFAIQFFSHCLRATCQSQCIGSLDADVIGKLKERTDPEVLSFVLPEMIDRTIQFQRHVETNMAMANIVPSWLNDLGAIARREKCLA